jgi:hypothetical protein
MLEIDLAGVWLLEQGQHFQETAFAGAISPDQSNDFIVPDRKVRHIENDAVRTGPAQVLD